MTHIEVTSPRCGRAVRRMKGIGYGPALAIRQGAFSMPGSRALEKPITDSLSRTTWNTRFMLWAACLSAMTTVASAQDSTMAVQGTFQPLNPAGEGISGTVSISPQGDRLVISLEMDGLAPGMHLAHVHGFPEADPADATCPDAAADANGDGWVDLIETRDLAGITMIPLTDEPAGLAIHSESYPSAGDDGRTSYEQAVDPTTLRNAVEAEFGTSLALPHRVVFIHGAPEETGLPESVQSLDGVPAYVTVPIACAELEASEG